MQYRIKHRIVNGLRRPYIVVKEPIDGFRPVPKKDNLFYAPLNNTFIELLADAGTTVLPNLCAGYDWPRPPHIEPYLHQKVTTEFMITHLRMWILNKMRSGKTLSTIWAIHRMFSMGLINKVLITAPLSILRSVWLQELFMVMPNRAVYVADESVEDMYNAMLYQDHSIIVCNHDKLRRLDETIDQWGPDLIVVDEAGGFRAVSSDRVDALDYILTDGIETSHRQHRRFIALTATPVPQSPLDIWRLGNMINRPIFPNSLQTYKNQVLSSVKVKPKPTILADGTVIKKKPVVISAPKKGQERYIQSLIEPAIKFTTEDCIDMPAQGYVTRSVHYSPPQKRALKAMKTDHASLIRDIESGEITEITAANAAVALSKYLQLCGGVVLDREGQPKIVGAKQRVDAIRSIMLEIGNENKMILFCMFTNVQDYIKQTLEKPSKDGPIINCNMLRGSMSGKERAKAVNDFQTDDDTRLMIVHPEVGKYGLNLSRANTTCWYTPVFSCDQYVQGNARMQAPLDKGIPEAEQSTTVVRLSGGEREDQLYARLLDKEARQDRITEVFRRLVTDQDMIDA